MKKAPDNHSPQTSAEKVPTRYVPIFACSRPTATSDVTVDWCSLKMCLQTKPATRLVTESSGWC